MLKFYTVEELKQKLQDLRRLGFDQVKLPGGTSHEGDHYSGVVIPYYNAENKTTYFLGLPYNSRVHIVNKEKDGKTKRKKPEQETPKKTAIREGFEETGLSFKENDLEELYNAELEKPGNLPGTVHTKRFFLVRRFTGEPAVFENGVNPIDPETGDPILFPSDFFKEVLWWGHKNAYKEGLQSLASTDKEICLSVMHLLN